MLVLVMLVLVIRAHGCARHEAASAATAGAAAAAQRSMDRVRGSGLPPRPTAAWWLPFCFAKISEFLNTRDKPKDVVGLADWRCERKEKTLMAVYGVEHHLTKPLSALLFAFEKYRR